MIQILPRSAAALLCAASMTLPTQAQVSTDFTYQGLIEQSGAPANGTADFIFTLFGEPAGGTMVAQSQNRSDVPVIDGRFAVTLNFGTAPFTDEGRWLEIAICLPAGTGNFITLTPRQEINPAPYAHKAIGVDSHSLNAADGDPVDALFVSNTGNVGIGTMTPFDKFFVRAGSNSWARVDSTHGDLHILPGSSIAGIVNDSPGADARTEVIVDNWPQLVINGHGGVGIGTTSPLRRLHVVDGDLWTARIESTASTYTGVDFVSNSNASWYSAWTLSVMGTAQGGNSGALYIMRPASAPTVYFALNNWVGLAKVPGFRLDLPNIANGDGRARANQWAIFSSARWKENVQTLENALDKLLRLRGVSFDWKPEQGGAHDIGFVAEEVGQVVPEIVTWEEDGQWAKGLAYDHVSALSVEAIKEQQGKLETLRRTNAQLQQQIDRLKGLLTTKRQAETNK